MFTIMAAELKARQGKSTPVSSIVCTLPITCQICLGKVRQPVLCPNYHVFCGACMNIWLERNHQCPACRVPINDDNPVKHIKGGPNQADDDEDQISSPELRRIRFNILFKDYEHELERLQEEMRLMRTENSLLKSKLSVEHNCTDVPTGTTPDSSTSATTTDKDRLLLLAKKLQDAQKLYDRVKADIGKYKQENSDLKDENVNLVRENAKLREEIAHRSPHRYGRYTVATLESQMDGQQKEIQRLTKALQRSDQYIEDLEHRLQTLQGTTQIQTLHNGIKNPHHTQSVSQDCVDSRFLAGEHNCLQEKPKDYRNIQNQKTGPSNGPGGLGKDIGEIRSSKRQLFTEGDNLLSRETEISHTKAPAQHEELEMVENSWDLKKEKDKSINSSSSTDFGAWLESITKQYGLQTTKDSLEGAKPQSVNGNEFAPETDKSVPESIMKKGDGKTTKQSQVIKDRSPSKRVQFDLQEKKSTENSSFDLEAPSPLTSSPLTDKYLLDSDDIPVKSTPKNYISNSALLRATPQIKQNKQTDSLRFEREADEVRYLINERYLPGFHNRDHAANPKGREPWEQNSSTANCDHKTDDKMLPVKLSPSSEILLSKEQVENNNSGLSELDISTPQSLTRSGGKSLHSEHNKHSGSKIKTKNTSFDLEEPSLDDTQTIQSELNDLDISMTPELSDCLKLLNRAEKKVHHLDTDDSQRPSGSSGLKNKHDNKFPFIGQGTAENMQASSVTANFPRTYMPGINGNMSSWEHGFFSSLKANPHKHAAFMQQPQTYHFGGGIGGVTYGSNYTSGHFNSGFDASSNLSRKDQYDSTSAGAQFQNHEPQKYRGTEGLAEKMFSLPSSKDDSHTITRPVSQAPFSMTSSSRQDSTASSGNSKKVSYMSSAGASERTSFTGVGDLFPSFSGTALQDQTTSGNCGYTANPSNSSTQTTYAARVADNNHDGFSFPGRNSTGNYSYVSNTSSVGGDTDSKHSDSFLPEPKKRLFDTDDESDFSSPNKTTKIF